MSKNKLMLLFVFISAAAVVSASKAETTVDKVLSESAAAIQDGQASQARVATAANEVRDLTSDFRQVNKINEDLAVYNKKLEIQVTKQNEQLAKLNKSMGDINNIQGRMLPLAIKMIDSLEQFIKLDLPFLISERTDRVAMLRASIDRPDITSAEKFRQVLEAYKIENEYGNRISTYLQQIPLAGKSREVNILQVGRIALLYQTVDGNETGAWDKKKKAWVKVDSGDYRSSVQQAIRIANKQASIDILSLPIPAAEAFKP